MATSLAGLSRRLPRLKRWAVIALVLAVGLLLLYSYLGFTWWTSTQELDTSTVKLAEIDETLRVAVAQEDFLLREVEGRSRELEAWASVFSLGDRLVITPPGTATTTTLASVAISGDAVAWFDLEIIPGEEYVFTLERAGNARHYKVGSEYPALQLAQTGLSYLEPVVQEWSTRAEDETVELEFSSESDNNGALQATKITLTVSDPESGAVVFGPEAVTLPLDDPQTLTFSNTSTNRELVVTVEPDGYFRMRKIGGDERLFVRPCPSDEGAQNISCPIGLFKDEDRHEWLIAWTEDELPDEGAVRLQIVAASDSAAASEGGPMPIIATDLLLEKVTQAAERAGVKLGAMSFSDPGQFDQEDLDIRYQVLPLNVKLDGPSHAEIYRFIKGLHDSLPIFEVDSTQLKGFGSAASATLVLDFHLAPGRIPKE